MLLTTQRIELPSWAFRGADLRGGDASALASARSSRAVSGVARSPYEVLADAAVVHHFTGTAPCVGLQFPSDHAADYADIACHAAELGLSISSLYVTARSRNGALCDLSHAEVNVRRSALEHLTGAVGAAAELGVERFVLRLGYDSRYAGEAEELARVERLREMLAVLYGRLPDGASLVLDPFAVGTQFYRGDPLWRRALTQCEHLGSAARLLVDTTVDEGVNPPILADLRSAERIAGLVVNTPVARFETFTALAEVLTAVDEGQNVLITLAPSPVRLSGVVPLITAVLAIQELSIKAAAVDRARLTGGDDTEATTTLLESFHSDVASELALARQEIGVDVDPLGAYDRACRAQYQNAQRRASVQRAAERRLANRRPDRRNRAASVWSGSATTGGPSVSVRNNAHGGNHSEQVSRVEEQHVR